MKFIEELLIFPATYAICFIIHKVRLYFKRKPMYESQTGMHCLTCGEYTPFKQIHFPTGQCSTCIALDKEEQNDQL